MSALTVAQCDEREAALGRQHQRVASERAAAIAALDAQVIAGQPTGPAAAAAIAQLDVELAAIERAQAALTADRAAAEDRQIIDQYQTEVNALALAVDALLADRAVFDSEQRQWMARQESFKATSLDVAVRLRAALGRGMDWYGRSDLTLARKNAIAAAAAPIRQQLDRLTAAVYDNRR